jgi:hypothetical protein
VSRREALVWMLGSAAVALAAAPVPVLAQAPARVQGMVQWISARGMQLMTDSGASVAIDLAEADQSNYRGIRPGDWVLVDGVLSSDRRRVVAREIWRDNGRGNWEQSP